MARLNMIFVSALLQNGLDLPQILQDSMARCHSSSLHTMVLFSAGQVMQAIDGEAQEAREEMQRLFHSAPYTNSVLLNQEEVEIPSLTGISLGAHQLASCVVAQLPPGVQFFKLSEGAIVQRVRSSIARNLLKQFAADYA